jgi:transglutaminase-like putative cysteine protease
MPVRPGFQAALDFDWVLQALEPLVVFEQGKADQTRVQSLAREIVAMCRANRDRVEAAERVLSEYRDVLSPEQKNEALRIMAETLLYIQHNGVRIKVTTDPGRILREGSGL